MNSPEVAPVPEGIMSTSLVGEILRVAERFYENNPAFTVLNTPTQTELGLEWYNPEKKPKSIDEAIKLEIEALVPPTTIALSNYQHSGGKSELRFKTGLVHGAKPHTYLALPGKTVVDEYRRRFIEYFPHRLSDTIALKLANPDGLPEGETATYIPLHSVIWCFVEDNGETIPIDALSLLTGEGFLNTLFESTDPIEQRIFQREKNRLRQDLLTAMAEYSHVAAVSIFHLYERYFKNAFIAVVDQYREYFGISLDWTIKLLEENFNLVRKGIRRHMNVGFHPDQKSMRKQFGLQQKGRDVTDKGRGPQTVWSSHIFLREVPFKKWLRLLLNSFEQQVSTGGFTFEQYRQLDELVHLALAQTEGWCPEADTPLFENRSRSEFLGADPYRFIKALDPYANWEGGEMLDLMVVPLANVLQQFGVYDVNLVEEMAEAVQPYNRNISAISMKFPKNASPGKIMAAIGDVMREVYWAKNEVFDDAPSEPQYQLLEKSKIRAWQARLKQYQPTRKMRGDTTDYQYSQQSTMEVLVPEIMQWKRVDRIHLYKQWFAQLLLYDWQAYGQTTELTGFADPAIGLLECMFDRQRTTENRQITWYRNTLKALLNQSDDTKQELLDALRSLLRHCTSGTTLSETKIANYIVIKTLENEKLGIRPKGQRPLNATSLPGFLLSYDYIEDTYLQFTLSPIISERGSMEQIKGIVLENR